MSAQLVLSERTAASPIAPTTAMKLLEILLRQAREGQRKG